MGTPSRRLRTGLGRRSEGKGCHRFASSGDALWFKELGSRLLGLDVGEVERLEWDGPYNEERQWP